MGTHVMWRWTLVFSLICGAMATSTVQAADDAYPFSLALQTLADDLTSDDYHAVLATMIPTDLRAEWQRVGTADNYHLFAKTHGGIDAVLANPALKRAYEQRKDVADRFLKLMRDAYAAKKQKPPFDDAELLLKVLDSADRRGTADLAAGIEIAPLPINDSDVGNWARLRGPTQQGDVLDAPFPTQWERLWRFELPGRGNSAPIIWGDQLLITSEGPRPEDVGSSPERFILSLDRRDGKLQWKHAAPPVKEVERLYWKNTFASSTVATDGARIVGFFGNSGLVCCDMQGERLWHVDLGTFPTTHGPGTTPVIYQDLVIVLQDQRQNQAESVFAAYDLQTGEKRWQQPRPQQAGWSSPVLRRIGNRDELLYNGSHVVSSYDPATGKELWRVKGPTEESIPSIITGGGLLYSASGRNGPVFAIRPGGDGDLSDTHVVWRNERGGPLVPTPAYHRDRLYMVNDTGILTCLNALTGETVWQQRLRGRFTMSPLVAGDLILVINEDGLATIFSAGDEYAAVSEHDLEESVLATPAVVDGRLYVRTTENVLCLGPATK